MLSRKDALDAALELWNEARRLETPRLDVIDAAMRVAPKLRPGATAKGAYLAGGRRPSVIIPDDAPSAMWELASKSETNYLPLIVRIFQQALRVDGYLSTAEVSDPTNSPWSWWQANRMDARQGGLHWATLKYGAGYVYVQPGESPGGRIGPTCRVFSPRKMTAFYANPEMDEWPIQSVFVDGPRGENLVLVDEDAEYRFALSTGAAAIPGAGFTSDAVASIGTRQMEFVGDRPHNAGMGVTPVIRYRDAFLTDGEEQYGLVEPLIVVQDRINELIFEQMVAGYFTAFKQKAVLGWVPSSEQEEMRANAGRVWYLDVNPEDVKIQEFGGAEPSWYSESVKAALRSLAAQAQIPPDVTGVSTISNISGETLEGLNAAKNERAGEIAVALGESHEQLMRTFAFQSGEDAAAQDYDGEVRWKQRNPRRWGSTIDGLVKLVQAQILARDTAIEMVPDMTDHQVEQARTDARVERAAANVAALRDRAAGVRAASRVPNMNLPDARD